MLVTFPARDNNMLMLVRLSQRRPFMDGPDRSFDHSPSVITGRSWALTAEAQGQVEVLGGPEPRRLRLDAQRGVVDHADIRRVVVVCVQGSPHGHIHASRSCKSQARVES